MRAVRIEQFGSPNLLKIREVPQPAAGFNQALIAVAAAAVNPSDLGNVAGKFPDTRLPRTPGRDYAGVVKEGPKELLGLDVWGAGGVLGIMQDGTHAEYVVVDSSSLRVKPATLTMEQAGSVGVAYSAAWLALVDRAAVRHGETVLVTGARGAVGQAATQIAHWRGAHVIGVDKTAAGGAEIEADHMIASEEGWSERVLEITKGHGVHAALDTVGGPLFEPTLKTLGHGGRHVAISAAGGDPRACFNLLDFYHRELILFGVDTFKLSLDATANILDTLRSGFDSGALRGPKVRTFPLDQALEAYQTVQRGDAREKVVLVV